MPVANTPDFAKGSKLWKMDATVEIVDFLLKNVEPELRDVKDKLLYKTVRYGETSWKFEARIHCLNGVHNMYFQGHTGVLFYYPKYKHPDTLYIRPLFATSWSGRSGGSEFAYKYLNRICVDTRA